LGREVIENEVSVKANARMAGVKLRSSGRNQKRTFDAVIVGAVRAGSSACRAAVGATGRELPPAADVYEPVGVVAQ
jgi:hypothetical protein